MNVYETNLYLTANFMYLHYCGKRPETIDDYFVKKNDSIHSYNTRCQKNKLWKIFSSV